MNMYDKLIELGCTNPSKCAKEYDEFGVTKFYSRDLHMVTVRNVAGYPHVTYPRMKKD